MTTNNYVINGKRYRNRFDINSFMHAFDSEKKIQSFSPVVQKNIGIENMKGVNITGSFSTDYDSQVDNGDEGLCYILVRRNNEGRARSRCGFGVAFRPTCIDSDATPYAIRSLQRTGEGYYSIEISGTPLIKSNTLYRRVGSSIVPFTYETYNQTTSLISRAYIPEQDITASDIIYVASPNVFIVDGTTSSDDAYFSEVIKGVSNVQCIASSLCLIKPNTTYNFKLSISDNNAAEFFIGEDKDALVSAISSPSATLLCEMNDPSLFTSFGVSVDKTCGKQWLFDDIKISRLSGRHIAAFFVISTTSLSENVQIYAKCGGYGVSDGVQLYVMNKNDGWDIVGAHSSSQVEDIRSSSFKKADYEDDGFITAMIVTSGKSSEETIANLYIDYVSIESVDPQGTHIGGFVDVYIDDPDIYPDSLLFTVNESRSISFDEENVAGIISLSNEGKELSPGFDYYVTCENVDELNSTKCRYLIGVAPWVTGSVAINHYKSIQLPAIQSFLSDGGGKLVGKNVLVKHKKVYTLFISSIYSPEIKEYLSNLTVDETYDISYEGIYSYLQLKGYSSFEFSVSYSAFNGESFEIGTISNPGDKLSVKKDGTTRISV